MAIQALSSRPSRSTRLNSRLEPSAHCRCPSNKDGLKVSTTPEAALLDKIPCPCIIPTNRPRNTDWCSMTKTELMAYNNRKPRTDPASARSSSSLSVKGSCSASAMASCSASAKGLSIASVKTSYSVSVKIPSCAPDPDSSSTSTGGSKYVFARTSSSAFTKNFSSISTKCFRASAKTSPRGGYSSVSCLCVDGSRAGHSPATRGGVSGTLSRWTMMGGGYLRWIFALTLLCQQTGSCDSPLPRFTEVVSNVTVVKGRDATLKCSVTNLKCSGDHHNTFKVAWVKADTQTLLSIEDTMISRNYRLRVSNSDSNTWFLHIDGAKLTDRGYYMCQVNTVPMLSRQGYLEVVVPPNIVDLETSGDVEVAEDSASTLRCHANGHPAPTVTFRREDGRALRRGGANGASMESMSESFDGTTLTKTSLSFTTTSRADMGHYLCIANNSVPPSVSKRIVLNVRYREPEVTVSHQMIGVYLGDDVTINCTVTSYPPPIVFWKDNNDKIIITAGRHQVIERQISDSPPVKVSTLLIRDVQPSDVATYRCSASIDNDSSRRKSLTVQLNEIARPSTQLPSLDILFNVPRQGKNMRKSASKQTLFNDIGDRHQKPTEFLPPDMFMHPNIAPANFDHSPETSLTNGGGGASKSETSSTSCLLLVTLPWVVTALQLQELRK